PTGGSRSQWPIPVRGSRRPSGSRFSKNSSRRRAPPPARRAVRVLAWPLPRRSWSCTGGELGSSHTWGRDRPSGSPCPYAWSGNGRGYELTAASPGLVCTLGQAYPALTCVHSGTEIPMRTQHEDAEAVAGHTWCLSFLRYDVVML